MKKIWIVFALLFCFSPVIMAQKPVKRALVFGIGEYKDPLWGKINGDKDIDYVLKMLELQKFDEVVVLKNEQATKKAMVNAFLDLAFRCNAGDKVYVHYSGHGQLMTDIDGDESLKWSGNHSKWDESWIPYDAYMMYGPDDNGEKHFSDDEVSEYLKEIRSNIGDEGELIVVIDACHSGDGTCSVEDIPIRGIGVKFSIPREDDMQDMDEPREPAKEEWLTISACKPYQLNMEMREPNVGKLTYALYQMGVDLFDHDQAELQEILVDFMEKNKGNLPQTPMVTGKKTTLQK